MPIPPAPPPPETPKDFDEPPAIVETVGRVSGTFDSLREYRKDAMRLQFEYVSDARLESLARDIVTTVSSSAPAQQTENAVLSVARRAFGSVAPPSADAEDWVREGCSFVEKLRFSHPMGPLGPATLTISNTPKPASSSPTSMSAAGETWQRLTHAVLDLADAWAEQRRSTEDAAAMRSLFYNAFQVDKNRPRLRPKR